MLSLDARGVPWGGGRAAGGLAVKLKLLPTVRKQYEDRPYPPRRPRDERKRLQATTLGSLARVNHVFWSGARQYDENFRVLDAGCGTGDSTVYMAEQLRKTPARVTAIDVSEASLKITRQRLAARGLDNADLIHAPIEEIPGMGLGPFDYIVCSGVLHHLASPAAGLETLRGVLTPDGGMGVMVYALYGRTAVYQMQQLFRLLAPPDWRDTRRLTAVKRTLEELHERHWAAFDSALWRREQREGGDAGLVDMFLHAQDRAYTVPQLYEWLDASGLGMVRFDNIKAYDPIIHRPDLDVRHLDERERQAAAELLDGRMVKHSFFACCDDYTPPAPPAWDDERAIPVWTFFDLEHSIEAGLKRSGKAKVYTDVGLATVEVSEPARAMLNAFDGRSPLGAGLDQADAAFPTAGARQILDAWKRAYDALYDINVLALNRPA